MDVVTPRNGVRLTPRFKEWGTGVSGLLGGLGAGAAIISFGIWLYRRPAKCEGEEMSPGDICITEGGGGREITRRDFSEVLESQQLFAIAVMAVGGLVILVAIGVASAAVRERLVSRRSRRGISTITPRPMTVILLGVVALVVGGVVMGLNVEAVLDVARCGEDSTASGDDCDPESYDSDESTKRALVSLAGFIVGATGLIAGIAGVRARRTGTWK